MSLSARANQKSSMGIWESIKNFASTALSSSISHDIVETQKKLKLLRANPAKTKSEVKEIEVLVQELEEMKNKKKNTSRRACHSRASLRRR